MRTCVTCAGRLSPGTRACMPCRDVRALSCAGCSLSHSLSCHLSLSRASARRLRAHSARRLSARSWAAAAWPDDDLVVTRFSASMTNAVYCVRPRAGCAAAEPAAVIVRAFGRGAEAIGMADAVFEAAVFRGLGEAGMSRARAHSGRAACASRAWGDPGTSAPVQALGRGR